MPQQQRHGDHRDHPEDQVRLAEVAALESAGALHLANPQRRDHAHEHEHGEDVDEQRVPAPVAEPRKGGTLVDHADQGDEDRRREHEEAPEDERVHQPRTEPLEELALTEDDRRLVTRPARHVAGATDRLGAAHEPDEQARAACEQGSARREGDGEEDGGDGRDYLLLAFLISAEIAGTTSWRSPITA